MDRTYFKYSFSCRNVIRKLCEILIFILIPKKKAATQHYDFKSLTPLSRSYGEPLMNEGDVIESLQTLGVIAGGAARPAAAKAAAPAAAAPAAPAAAAPAAGGGGGGARTILAPMDGEGVYLTFHAKVGDSVKKGDVVIEVESDKATIEV
jgi:pyruvate/2-oxoglutarate dehydrogenase complex dihydrolipoamide acyltransferase (E2) component